MKLTRLISFTFALAAPAAILLLLALASGQAQPAVASLQPSAPEMSASDRNDALPKLTAVPILTPTGYSPPGCGTFNYTWSGMAGHQYWFAPGGESNNETR